MQANKERYYYLDILKLTAIFLVCSYHFSIDHKILFSTSFPISIQLHSFILGICSVCVPLFFMVNGSLLLNSKLNITKHLKRTFTMFLQFLFWKTVTILIISSYRSINLKAMEFSEIFNAFFLFGNIEGIDLSHLWFVPCLLGVYAVTPLIKREYDYFMQKNKQPYLIVFMLILFFVCFVPYDVSTLLKLFPLTSKIDASAIAKTLNPFAGLIGPMLLYFMLGGMLHRKIDSLKGINILYLAAAFLTGASLLLFKWNIETAFSSEVWDNVYNAYNSVPTLIMAISLFIICGKASGRFISEHKPLAKTLEIVSGNTMNVYYTHWILGSTLLAYIMENYINAENMPLNVLKAITMVIVFSAVCELLKKIPVIKNLFH